MNLRDNVLLTFDIESKCTLFGLNEERQGSHNCKRGNGKRRLRYNYIKLF